MWLCQSSWSTQVYFRSYFRWETKYSSSAMWFFFKYRARISNCPHLHFLYNEGIYLCSFKLYIFTYKIYGNIQCCKSCIWLIPVFLLAVFFKWRFHLLRRKCFPNPPELTVINNIFWKAGFYFISHMQTWLLPDTLNQEIPKKWTCRNTLYWRLKKLKNRWKTKSLTSTNRVTKPFLRFWDSSEPQWRAIEKMEKTENWWTFPGVATKITPGVQPWEISKDHCWP